MPYTKSKKAIPARDAALLARATQPGLAGPYDQVAPGLYPDETTVELDSGELVAVSVERHWQENNSGIAFHAYARWIEPDGSTKTTPDGKQIESAFSMNVGNAVLEEVGEDAIATELARAVLGEPPALQTSVPKDGGGTEQVNFLRLEPRDAAAVSVRRAIRNVRAASGHAIKL